MPSEPSACCLAAPHGAFFFGAFGTPVSPENPGGRCEAPTRKERCEAATRRKARSLLKGLHPVVT
jgi:hypothetical protein